MHHTCPSCGSVQSSLSYLALLALFTASAPSAAGFICGQPCERPVLSSARLVYIGPQQSALPASVAAGM